MGRLGRILLASVAAVIGLLVIATVTLFLLFDPNDYKDYLSDWVRAQTGREFEVRDELELSFFPWLAIETGGINLGNAPGFTDQYFATAQRLAVRVRLLPLLRRQVEVGTIVIDGLELNLSRNSDGMNNWDDLFARDQDTGAGAAAPATPSQQSVDIAGITLRDALIFWREDSEVRYILRNASLSTGTISPGRPVEAGMEFDFALVKLAA